MRRDRPGPEFNLDGSWRRVFGPSLLSVFLTNTPPVQPGCRSCIPFPLVFSSFFAGVKVPAPLARTLIFSQTIQHVVRTRARNDARSALRHWWCAGTNVDGVAVRGLSGSTVVLPVKPAAWNPFRHRISLLAPVCGQAQTPGDMDARRPALPLATADKLIFCHRCHENSKTTRRNRSPSPPPSCDCLRGCTALPALKRKHGNRARNWWLE